MQPEGISGRCGIDQAGGGAEKMPGVLTPWLLLNYNMNGFLQSPLCSEERSPYKARDESVLWFSYINS